MKLLFAFANFESNISGMSEMELYCDFKDSMICSETNLRSDSKIYSE